MVVKYSLTPELRTTLKRPLGTLIRGSFTETMGRFGEIVKKEKQPIIISVGDAVSRNLVDSQLFPRLAIIDNKRMRRNVRTPPLAAEKILYVKNPRGTVTEDAIVAIQEALKENCRTKIVVEGEEDLLALVAIVYAPEGSFVLYGQPYEGVVMVKITQDKKAEIRKILKAMEKFEKLNKKYRIKSTTHTRKSHGN